MNKVTNIIDDNGEIVSTKKAYFKDTFDEEKGYLFWNKTGFVKTFQDVSLPTSVTKVDIANLFLLSKKVYSTTNMIGYRGNGGIRVMSVEQMAKVIKDTDRHTISFLNRMIKSRVMARVEVKIGEDTSIQYYFNPIYFFSSNRLSQNLYLLFQKDLDPFIPEYAKQKFRLSAVKGAVKK